MNQIQSLQKNDPDRAIEFVPFGAADKIKLSVRIIQNIVAVPTKSGQTCAERDALKFLMMCQAQRLNPFAGDAFLVGYDGRNGPQFSLITAHQAVLKRAETCPEFEGMESGIILLDEEGGKVTEREGDFHLDGEKVVGGWARVHRKGRKDTYRRIRLSRFNNGFAQWAVDPAGMIVKCAEADALRSTFPTLLGGLYIQGEMDGAADRIVSQIVTTKPIFDMPNKLAVADRRPEVAEQPIDEGEGTDLGPQPKLEEKNPEPEGALLNVTLILKQARLHKITEADLLDFLRSTGRLDDSISSLEEMSMVALPSLKWMWENWSSVIDEVKKRKTAQPKAA